MRIHAILLAGGTGDRFRADIPKQFIRLAGEPILVRSARALTSSGIDQLVVVAHPDWLDETDRLLAGFAMPVTVVAGGPTRNASTLNGLAALGAAYDDVVVVHDAVRPLLPVEVVRRAVAPILAGEADATDTVIPSADTLVIVDADRVTEIPDRSRYRRGQTPQAFRVGTLIAAYTAASAANDLSATDDCSLVIRHVPGARVVAVAGDEINIKITTRIDMVLADRMIQMRTLEPTRQVRRARALDGDRILVVGGTSGIGSAVADAAAAAGAQVAVLGRSTGVDIRDPAATDVAIDNVAERLGGLDHVVCTAGLLRVGDVAATTPADLAEVFEVNVLGTLHVARSAFPHLRARRGSFTAFASSSFTRGRQGYVAYSASKAAVVNMVQGLAEEWAPDGVRVNAVSPERTATPMRRRAFPDEPIDGLLSPAEVAATTIALLESDLTGQVVDVRRHDATDPDET